MNFVARHINTIKEIAIVNGVSFGTIGITKLDIVRMNDIIQSTGQSLIIIATLFFTLYKIYKEIKSDDSNINKIKKQ